VCIVQDIDFPKSYFLVQCFGVLLDIKSPTNCAKIGAKLATLVEIDLCDDGGAVLRMKIEMYVQSPLRPGFPLKQYHGLDRWIELKYERLINFCFTYQKRGHENRSCETQA